jgi:colanic acid/amylovoran biosynthesis protein
LAPDITLTFKKEIKIEDKEFTRPFVAIVPNERMLDKASEQWQIHYHEVLKKSIVDILANSDFNVVMLIHAQGVSNDAKVGKEILAMVPAEFADRLLFYVEEDPVRLKAIISKAAFIIGSRFHAVASSLSSNVPAIGTSWLHKYEMLFSDYSCADFSFKEPDAMLYEKVKYLLKEENRADVIGKLKKVNTDMKQKHSKMWELIEGILIK